MTEKRQELEREVINTLLYFDIFHYPLKRNEIFSHLQINSVAQEEVDAAINRLLDKCSVYQYGEFYSLHNDLANIERRIKGNAFAERLRPLVQKRAKLISRFPFVRAVMASGSFSKNYMDENSDVDFFIVTEPGRLWIARTLLVLYKRVVLFNSHKYFCINYFLDEQHLEIEEKNLFTATELASLIPLYGHDTYRRLVDSNRWVRDYLPNIRARNAPKDATGTGILKTVAQKLLNVFGSRLEDFLMRITLRRFQRMYGNQYSRRDFAIAFKSKRHTSKNHPKHYQKKVMEAYHERMKLFERHHTTAAHS